MEKLKAWPPVLLRKWLLTCVIGIGCLLVGIVMFLAAGDRVMLMIGNCYRAYFQPSGTASEAAPFQSFLVQDQFLALEDLGEYRAGVEDDSEKTSEVCGN